MTIEENRQTGQSDEEDILISRMEGGSMFERIISAKDRNTEYETYLNTLRNSNTTNNGNMNM